MSVTPTKNMDKEQILFKIKHLLYYVRLILFDDKNIESGLIKNGKDERNFKTESLGWSLFGYTPKNVRKFIAPFKVLDQSPYNACVWYSAIGAKMVDEKIELSVSDIISYAQRQGYISGNGFASLDSAKKALRDYGVREGINEQNNGDWNNFSNQGLNTIEASKHKIKTYWEVSSRDDIIKLLDEGKPVTTGMDWYTGFNQGGGFSAPWLITKPLGYKVGGHALWICGYDLNYQGHKVYRICNSYSQSWGDGGTFYIDMDYLDKNASGFYADLDLDVSYGSFLTKYDGKNVKGSDSAIYFIQNGQRKVYPNWSTYLAFGGKYTGFTQLSGLEIESLNNVPTGDIMDIKKSPAWADISDITNLDDSNHNLMSTLINLSKSQLGII